MKKNRAPKKAPAVSIDGVIHTVRGERVILDADLAKIYGIETRVLNQAVRRNRDKFPPDFLLELNHTEERDGLSHHDAQIDQALNHPRCSVSSAA